MFALIGRHRFVDSSSIVVWNANCVWARELRQLDLMMPLTLVIVGCARVPYTKGMRCCFIDA